MNKLKELFNQKNNIQNEYKKLNKELDTINRKISVINIDNSDLSEYINKWYKIDGNNSYFKFLSFIRNLGTEVELYGIYIDFSSDMPTISYQTIPFIKNMLNITFNKENEMIDMEPVLKRVYNELYQFIIEK